MDVRAFEAFVNRTQDKALRLAYGYLDDWEEARDAVQESFIKTHDRAPDLADASLATWFYRVLTNHLRDRLRRRKVRSWLRLGLGEPETERTPAPGPDPQAEHYAGALGAGIRAAVAALPKRQREVFRHKALGERTFAETARELSISEGAAKAHYFRAVQTLRAHLQPWRDDA